MKLCSVADVKGMLPLLNTAYTAKDTVIDSIISSVSAKISAYVERAFSYGRYVERHSTPHKCANSPYLILLKEYPVSAVSGELVVEYDYSGGFVGNQITLVEGSDYTVERDTGRLYVMAHTRAGRTLRVSYYGGYEETATGSGILAVPVPVNRAAVLQAVFEFDRSQSVATAENTDDRSNSQRRKNITANNYGLIADAASLLYPLRRVKTGRY